MRFPGSVSLSAQTFRNVVHDVAMSAADAGFKNVFIMGDHGDGQNELAAVAKGLDAQWKPRGVRVFYVGDLYNKEKAQSKAYAATHGLPTTDVHAGFDDTSELMALDAPHRWIRSDKIAASTGARTAITGVDGDPTKSSPALGEIFLKYKIDDAVAEITEAIGRAVMRVLDEMLSGGRLGLARVHFRVSLTTEGGQQPVSSSAERKLRLAGQRPLR